MPLTHLPGIREIHAVRSFKKKFKKALAVLSKKHAGRLPERVFIAEDGNIYVKKENVPKGLKIVEVKTAEGKLTAEQYDEAMSELLEGN